MKWIRQTFGLASLLLVCVMITNYVPDLIGSFYVGREVPAAKAWQLVFRGLQACFLFMAAWYLVPWKPALRRVACAVACAWGFFESVQVVFCRLAFDMTRPPPQDTRLYTGLCDIATGLPVYMGTLLTIMAVVTLVKLRKEE